MESLSILSVYLTLIIIIILFIISFIGTLIQQAKEKKWLWLILTIMFPLIGVVIYQIRRMTKKLVEKEIHKQKQLN